VPFFVFNQAYAVSGAQGEESFLHVLNTVAEKSKQ
jgi:predicted DsbA family dithiol-disulfide isomerase